MTKYNKFRFLFLATILILGMANKNTGLSSCNDEVLNKKVSEEDNLIVYLSNQSQEKPSVDINLFIDGKLMVDIVQDYQLHGRSRFGFKLKKGKHELKLISQIGETTLEKEFIIAENHWMAISYYFSTGKRGGLVKAPVFAFRFQNEPIYFR